MQWDLGLPLLIMLATAIVMVLIVVAARNLIFDARRDEGTDAGPGG